MKKIIAFIKTPLCFRISLTVASIFTWLALWELFAALLDLEFIFPGAIQTIKTLLSLSVTADFWKIIFLSMLRILLGLALGIVLGVLLALIYQLAPVLRSFINIGMTVIKSTPVASIILVLWIVVNDGSQRLPMLIALLMVMPIIWQNICDGFSAIDKNLSEVCDVFEFSLNKRIKLLIFPTLLRYFIPALLSSIGLAWKSGIAAEIISYTKNSIGKNILDSKNLFDGDIMLAWTLTVVILSLILEYSVRALVRRWNK